MFLFFVCLVFFSFLLYHLFHFFFFFFFFFQAEDGIRDTSVTGVQTCALPISQAGRSELSNSSISHLHDARAGEGPCIADGCRHLHHLFPRLPAGTETRDSSPNFLTSFPSLCRCVSRRRPEHRFRLTSSAPRRRGASRQRHVHRRP